MPERRLSGTTGLFGLDPEVVKPKFDNIKEIWLAFSLTSKFGITREILVMLRFFFSEARLLFGCQNDRPQFGLASLLNLDTCHIVVG